MSKHIRSPLTFGGVGILVKCNLLSKYLVTTVDKTIDGILGVKFQCKETDYSFIIFSCYLPPDKSPWAEPDIFFEHLISQLYVHSSENAIYICGDFNSRIGSELDCVNFDELPKRIPKDTFKNSYSENFLEFLKYTKCCILNGRFKPDKDNYTSTNRGNAVVDFIIVPHDCFKNCENFEVHLINDIMCKFDLQSLITSHSKPPDHSAVCVDIFSGHKQAVPHSDKNHVFKSKRYDFSQIPDGFMANDTWRQSIEQVINKLEDIKGEQLQVNRVYDEFCKLILSCTTMPTLRAIANSTKSIQSQANKARRIIG